MSCSPNVLNNVVEFSFADYIVLFLCKYKDIEYSGSYSNDSTLLLNADTSVNLCRVDVGSLTSYCGKDIGSNVVTM